MKWITKAVIALSYTLAPITVLANPISIGANPQGSLSYATAVAISDVVGDIIDARFTIVPQGGPTAIFPALVAGEYELAVAKLTTAADAVNGSPPFRRKLDSLRVVAVLYPLHSGLLVKADSDIRVVRDLAGQRVASEFKSQGHLHGQVEIAMRLADLTYNDVTPVPVQSGPQAVDDLIAGNLDVAYFSVGSGVVAKADAAVGVRFLSLPTTEKAKAFMREARPGASIVQIPTGIAAGILSDTAVVEEPFTLITNDSVDSKLVYEIVKAIAESKDQLAIRSARFKLLDSARMGRQDSPVPYHPGAIQYYEDQGTW